MGAEVGEQAVHLLDGRAVPQIAALARLRHQAGVHQLLQVERQRRARQVQHDGQLTRRQALGRSADQGAKDAQAHALCQGSERNDGGFFFHISIFVEI